MTLETITSEDYINDIINFLPEKPISEYAVAEKAKKNFDRIINSPNFIFDRYNENITNSIRTLVTIRPGRSLFKRLLKADQPLTIVFDPQKEPVCNYDRQAKAPTVTLNSKVFHHISVTSNGEKIFSPAPDFLILVHELIHALHYFEEGPTFVEKKVTFGRIPDPAWDDLEELETIMGKIGTMTLCENVFRYHFGHPLRINHLGISLNEEETPTVSTCAMRGILGSLKELLLSKPSLLNLPQFCSNTSIQEPITPLNASISAYHQEITDYLFQLGVDVNVWDSHYGTALHVAILTNQLDLSLVLLEKGADIKVKNPQGYTTLELALLMNNDEMVELLAPLSNLKELDEKRLSILHRALTIENPDGFRALIRHGADINCKDLEGNTPLMYSCGANASIVNKPLNFQILLESDHLDLNAKNIHGESALSLLIRKLDFFNAYALLKKGAEIPLELKESVKECVDWYNDIFKPAQPFVLSASF